MELRYFKHEEFDSPDAKGSGANMNADFLKLLDEARHIAGVPFRISSGGGFRTKEYNAELCKRNKHASKTSSHMKGLAADILVDDSRTRFNILFALLRCGFNRIGVANGFIHVDVDEAKTEDLCWTYM
jgi:uncharacterized protein YcbK (DUF882 family)